MDKTTHEIRLANWKQLIEQCASRPKGQTIQQLFIVKFKYRKVQNKNVGNCTYKM
jgi:hypothetical protein